MMFFIIVFLIPMITAICLMAYWFVISIKDDRFISAAIIAVVIGSVIGTIGTFLG